jgi:D-glycero-alpha-D-manno-heptose-7-phosphate kinase
MVISRTPLRVSFAGGASDLPAFADEHGGAVVSTTIDRFVHVIVTERFDGVPARAGHNGQPSDELDGLVREARRLVEVEGDVEVAAFADVPWGSGLGSSGALAVGLVNALSAYRGRRLPAAKLAAEACRIEIERLGRPVGRQDAYAAAFGGLQLLRFGPGDEVRREPVDVPSERLPGLYESLLLFHTGRSRSAAAVLTGIASAIGESERIRGLLVTLRDSALELAGELRAEASPDALGRRLRRDWQVKRALGDGVSDDEIEGWLEQACAAGATGGKLLGAGGGGFLLIAAPPQNHDAVRRALAGLRELPLRAEPAGSRIVYAD